MTLGAFRRWYPPRRNRSYGISYEGLSPRSSNQRSVVHWVMQVEKAPLESYADVGGLEQQIQEIKEAVELPLTHPELYEDIGIKPPKVVTSLCKVWVQQVSGAFRA